eukprot:5423690-Amphidinium_carterae.1
MSTNPCDAANGTCHVATNHGDHAGTLDHLLDGLSADLLLYNPSRLAQDMHRTRNINYSNAPERRDNPLTVKADESTPGSEAHHMSFNAMQPCNCIQKV